MAKNLSPIQGKFVEAYLSGKTFKQAAIDAGYSQNVAERKASDLAQIPAVKAALAEARKAMVTKGVYSLEKAMIEVDEHIEFARQTKNANAIAKLFETKTKLNGLLIEKHDIKGISPIAIVIGRTSKKAQEEQEAEEEAIELNLGEDDIFG